jgi:hypothetical protein
MYICTSIHIIRMHIEYVFLNLLVMHNYILIKVYVHMYRCIDV